MNTGTFHATARTTSPASAPAARGTTGGHRLADYIVDVFFIVLLAAPFVIFQSPGSVQEAVGAAPVQVQAPADADAAYGPE